MGQRSSGSCEEEDADNLNWLHSWEFMEVIVVVEAS
jgi:hypothetical protein